jgi:hypothetical protein
MILHCEEKIYRIGLILLISKDLALGGRNRRECGHILSIHAPSQFMLLRVCMPLFELKFD